MLRRTLPFLLVVLSLAPVRAADRFASVSFHDVVDFKGDLDDEAVTVDRLIAFFEWLRANRWTAISLDDVDAARRGEKGAPRALDPHHVRRRLSQPLHAGVPAGAGVPRADRRRARGELDGSTRGRQGELRPEASCQGSTLFRGTRCARWRNQAWWRLLRTVTICTTA